MPKEPSVKQFRKGTKSCVECRQRKLRCIPAADESQPCKNCASKGRECILQTNIGRNVDGTNVTSSRDRIRQLEWNVSRLWSSLRQLRAEVGHPEAETAQSLDGHSELHDGGESDSESSDMSLGNAPTHLQQLFDNQYLNSEGYNIASPGSGLDKSTGAQWFRARTKLQALMPPKEDVQASAPLAAQWFEIYNTIFPPFRTFQNISDIVLKYDELAGAGANPVAVAALLLWVAIAVQNASGDMPKFGCEAMQDGQAFVRNISDNIEQVIVSNDTLAGSVEGIEVSLLWIRLQLARVNIKKMWLMLRRCIALGELIGLQRAYAAHLNGAGQLTTPAETRDSAAGVWESLAVIDRIVGLMFNLPLGTARHAFSAQDIIVSSDGRIDTQAYLTNLAKIAAYVNELDESVISKRPDSELFEKVLVIDQELRTLREKTPIVWWSLGPRYMVADHLVQYWHQYILIRAHLQLALRNSTCSETAYSYLTCLQACRELSSRFVRLRSILPVTFFAGRILDLEAMTAAVFLIYISHRPVQNQVLGSPNDRELAYEIVRQMDAISNQTIYPIGGDIARKAAKAIRSLDELLGKPVPTDSQTMSLRIPLLGKVNVGRSFSHQQGPEQTLPLSYNADQGYMSQPTSASTLSNQMTGPLGLDTSTLESSDPLQWSMDLMMEDFPAFGDSFGTEQWLSLSYG